MCDRHYIHMGNISSNLFNIERSGAPRLLTPIQMARLIYNVSKTIERLADKDRPIAKTGTSENSCGQHNNYSGSHPRGWRIVTDLVTSKLEKLVITCRDGGKIVEEAEAGGNSPEVAGSTCPSIQRTPKAGEQNSTMLSVTYTHCNSNAGRCYTRGRCLSTYRKDVNRMK